MRVDAHFAKSAPEVLATYKRLLETARAFGPVVEEPKKTFDPSFVAYRVCRRGDEARVVGPHAEVHHGYSQPVSPKTGADVSSPLAHRHSPTKPADVDKQLTTWLRAAYTLGGVRFAK